MNNSALMQGFELSSLALSFRAAAVAHPALAGVSVRKCTRQDRPFLRQVYSVARAAEMVTTGWDESAIASFLDLQFDLQHRYWRDHYRGAEFLVIQFRGQPIGRVYWWSNTADAVLIDISLLPAWRNRGVGSGIVAVLNDRADASRQTTTLHLQPTSPAHSLFLRAGFIIVDDNSVHLKMQRSLVAR